MTLRLAFLASGLMFAAACDDGSSKDSEDNGDDGSGDDGGDPAGDGGDPAGDGGDPGGDGGGPAGDGGGPGGGDGGGPGAGDGGGPGGDGGDPGGDPGGDGGDPTMNGAMGIGLAWVENDSLKYCDLTWYRTAGTESSTRCDDCDIGWGVDAHWDLEKDCFGAAKPGDDFGFYAGHLTYAGYDYWAQSYNGADWYYSWVAKGTGGGTGYAYYYYLGEDLGGKWSGYAYWYHGYASY